MLPAIVVGLATGLLPGAVGERRLQHGFAAPLVIAAGAPAVHEVALLSS